MYARPPPFFAENFTFLTQDSCQKPFFENVTIVRLPRASPFLMLKSCICTGFRLLWRRNSKDYNHKVLVNLVHAKWAKQNRGQGQLCQRSLEAEQRQTNYRKSTVASWHLIRDWSLITGRGGGGYKIGKLRVWNFLSPPPPPPKTG